jgi:hypothetical protein
MGLYRHSPKQIHGTVHLAHFYRFIIGLHIVLASESISVTETK